MSTLLSVIMPTYNGQEFLAAALESVRSQRADNFELVIVDDGSSDRTLEIIRDFSADLPIRLITPGRRGNWVAVSNIGLREAKGEWACFLHQDDLWLPGRLLRIRREMEKSEGAVVLHNAMFIGPQGEELGPWTCPLPEGVVPVEQFVERLLVQNFIAIPSPVFRREEAVRSGGMDESLWYSADWDFWLRLGKLGPVRFIEDTLSAFRVHPASQTASRKLKPNEWQHQLDAVLARHMENKAFAGKFKPAVKKAARASVTVNCAMAAASRGEPYSVPAVLGELLALGPFGLRRYVRDSRIMQRVGSRLKVQWKIGKS